ncbi:uncharacterized protein M421DRAFT_180611 [Didymella exigua CBS 183.55]|uniref:Uncharacterized protein n=1 Tax=Didymella exigua CBS 183.55 TaxID=1150837 RepID=A0A6A5RKH9_9PLEO|nr:uncharacterized protein M421DRAFT_180611 [Didymella exigua CBS 183.55]KAF1927474.1 hypothetical protein M421DRAFT_180611 [Didymella exigua CBS 183.55]
MFAVHSFEITSCVSTIRHLREISIWRSLGCCLQSGGRVNFVAPIAGIGARKWLPFPEESLAETPQEFMKPDLSVLDVNVTGVLYTVALAVQHFRRQTRKEDWLLGRIGLVASV